MGPDRMTLLYRDVRSPLGVTVELDKVTLLPTIQAGVVCL